jgi:hypothetical protein
MSMLSLLLVIVSLLVTSSGQKDQAIEATYSTRFFQLASITYANSSSSAVDVNRTLNRLHLIRVPKASSTALSIVARRLVGCIPRGPCCKYPGDPVGSCPSKLLYSCKESGKVIGCVHHYPHLKYLYPHPPVGLLSISMLRHPYQRSISAFFYTGSLHHDEKCTEGIIPCYFKYATSVSYSNIAVRMFSGAMAYQPSQTCREKNKCRHSLELALQTLKRITFVGVSELWELSMFLLHSWIPDIKPLLEDFSLSEHSSLRPEGKIRFSVTKREFSSTVGRNFSALLKVQNNLDMELYIETLKIICSRIISIGLWDKHDWVKLYWWQRLDVSVRSQVTNCLPTNPT